LPNWIIYARDDVMIELGYFDRELYGGWPPTS